MRKYVFGGGRGSKSKRRVAYQARDGIAILHSMNAAGIALETATEILNTFPVVSSLPNDVIDFSPEHSEWKLDDETIPISLAAVDPTGGWRIEDTVPGHVFNRMCQGLVKADAPENVPAGDIAWVPCSLLRIYRDLPYGFKSFCGPTYRPEIDPIGTFDFWCDLPDVKDRYDHRIYVVDGRWIFIRYADPEPRQQYLKYAHSYYFDSAQINRGQEPSFEYFAFAEIDRKTKTVRALQAGDDVQQAAKSAWTQYETKLEINTSLAVRRMKRNAYWMEAYE